MNGFILAVWGRMGAEPTTHFPFPQPSSTVGLSNLSSLHALEFGPSGKSRGELSYFRTLHKGRPDSSSNHPSKECGPPGVSDLC